MRLLSRDKNGRFVFTDQRGWDDNPFPYAILSHTWSTIPDEELLYHDMLEPNLPAKGGAIQKLHFIADLAKKENLDYFWVDTCCIDKTNDDELKESIRSMFEWYNKAAVCYVYLTDVTDAGINKRTAEGQIAWHESFRKCRWMKRGWTLQELLAPQRVEFYAHENYLGDRKSLSGLIASVTNLDIAVLKGTESLFKYSHFLRLQWIGDRKTFKEEDKYYSLMGICQAHIEVKYGEKEQSARLTLMDKIRSNHGSITLDGPAKWVNGQWRAIPTSDNTEAARQTKLELLEFEAMDNRKEAIKNAHRQTCVWIRQHDHFKNWMQPKSADDEFEILWIAGKPGAGKSVLVKSLNNYIRTTHPGDINICFYFSRRGESLEQSFFGMYRSLLVQLLRADPYLQDILDNAKNITIESNNTIRHLQQMISAAVARIKNRRLFCFVDALDECDQFRIQDMVDYFEELGNSAIQENVLIHVCFASRHYPSLNINTNLKIDLDMTDAHEGDIRKYLQDQKYNGSGGLKRIDKKVQEVILKKANHVFLWVVLVVGMIKEDLLNGRVHHAMDKLERLPEDLAELFETIVRRDGLNLAEEFYPCLQWLLFARRPLSLGEFYYAMMASIPDGRLESTSDVDDDAMKNFLVSSSKGLAELTRGKNGRVQFIHETVREFLAGDKAAAIFQDATPARPSQGHQKLRDCCIKGIAIDTRGWQQHVLKDQTGPHSNGGRKTSLLSKGAKTSLSTRFPFLGYAVESVFYHAENAASEISQTTFIQTLLPQILPKWVEKFNWLVTLKGDILTALPDLSITFSERNCPRLLEALRNCDYTPPPQNWNRYRGPLFAAFARRSIEAARFVLVEQNALNPEQIIQEVFFDNYKPRRVYERKRPGCPGGNPVDWVWAWRHGYPELMIHSLRRMKNPGKPFRDAFSKCIRAKKMKVPLMERVMNAHNNVKTWSQDFLNFSINEAAFFGSAETIQFLLNRGARVVYRDSDLEEHKPSYGYPLLSAVYAGTVKAGQRDGVLEKIRLLLQNGADVDFREGEYGNALQMAAHVGTVEMVEILLEHGADVNAQGGEYGNALQAAVCSAKTGYAYKSPNSEASGTASSDVESTLVDDAESTLMEDADETPMTDVVDTPMGDLGATIQNQTFGKVAEEITAEKSAADNAAAGQSPEEKAAAEKIMAEKRAMEKVELLILKGANIHAEGGKHGTAIQAAIDLDLNVVEQMLLAADPMGKTYDPDAPFYPDVIFYPDAVCYPDDIYSTDAMFMDN